MCHRENESLRVRIAELEAQLPEHVVPEAKLQVAEELKPGAPPSDSLFQHPKHTLSGLQITRYGRHFLLPSFGVKGQEAICRSRVLVVGAGGLGAPVITYLASNGVGTLGIADGDVVDLSNLHRQTIHSEATVGMSKARSAQMFVKNLNSNIQVEIFPEFLTLDNVLDAIAKSVSN